MCLKWCEKWTDKQREEHRSHIKAAPCSWKAAENRLGVDGAEQFIFSTATPTSTEASLPGQDFCFLENFEANCPEGLAVRITLAELGRMRVGRCVRINHGHVGCKDDVTAHVQERCGNRNTCVFHVSELGALVQSCPANRLAYLYVEHECQIGTH